MQFEDYLKTIPLLHSWDGGKTWGTGGFDRNSLASLYSFLREKLPKRATLLETGAGNSTIAMLFLNPAKIISIAPDPKLFERIHKFCLLNGISDASIEKHMDCSQWVLPQIAAKNRSNPPMLDFALIDGCHGWPTAFVDLEYTNFLLKEGGYLMIDDVQLHSLKEMARLIAEHPAYSIAHDIRKSLIFKKVKPSHSLGEWTKQPYIVRLTEEYSKQKDPYSLFLKTERG
jgi:predicted O-methyltransferase YrrM